MSQFNSADLDLGSKELECNADIDGKVDGDGEVELEEGQTEEQTLTDIENPTKHVQTEDQGPRRSERDRVPTEKMRAYQEEEAKKREGKFLGAYQNWKVEVRNTRDQLKADINTTQIAILVEVLDEAKNNMIKLYEEIRQLVTPMPDIRRRMDACEAVTADIIKIAYDRIAGLDEFDAVKERNRLHALLDCDYAHSIYGSAVSEISQHSNASVLAVKRADAAAEVAAKEAEYEVMLQERQYKEKIQELEEQHKKALQSERNKLEQLKAEKDLKAAHAKLRVYTQESEREMNTLPLDACADIKPKQEAITTQSKPNIPKPKLETVTTQRKPNIQSTSDESTLSLAQALQDSLALSRLPTPEPSVFTGDPIQFIEWKSSFMALIDQKNISAADKLFYLKKYVSGSARKTLEGAFYRNDKDAYLDAWNRLETRYGQPFMLQKAFRDRLSHWQRINPKDACGLREFSDFLTACQDAMPHVKGLQILNDCQENQKLVQKLPDWAISRWNRQVTQTLSKSQEYPSFREFAEFVALEAEIACNPVTSFYALHAPETLTEKRNLRDNGGRVRVLSTQTNNEQNTEKGSTKLPCAFCQEDNHQLPSCVKFITKDLEERKKFVREGKLCYGCLRAGHIAKECRLRHTCSTCKGKHPTSLHDDNYVKSIPVVNSDRVQDEARATALNVATSQSTNTSMIVPVWVSTKSNPCNERLVYALLDTQSDTTFIDQTVSDSLQAESCPVKLKLTTMLGKDKILQSCRVTGLQVRSYSSDSYIDLPPTYTKDYIPVNRTHIPTCDTAKYWNHLAAIAKEMPPLQDCDVGLLIGYNCSRAMAPRKVIVGKDEEPYGIYTDLGWSIVGHSPAHLGVSQASGICHRIAVKELPAITPMDAIRVLETDFKDVSEDGKKVSQDDILFINKMKENIKKNSQGHYEMPLPFKERPTLPDNIQLATARLNHLRRKLSKDKTLHQHYTNFMREIIDRGDAEETKEIGVEGESWYLPHHGVYHSKKPGKLRVVFDCSAKYENTCLNDHLLQGPDMINNLNGILIRFRQHPVALMCDVEKMFHQFHVEEADRNYLRFLWWKNGEIDRKPDVFRMKVHLFGATSSPACANYGLKHLAQEYSSDYPLGAQFVIRNFYVDDGVTSVASTKDAIRLATEARMLCAKGGLRLHKFMSNDAAVMESLPPSERAEVKNVDFASDDILLDRTLGIQWQRESDNFKFRIHVQEQSATRRNILSTVASVYDPLGFIAPVLLNGKRILQEMCKNGANWDEPLPFALTPRWELWKGDLTNLQDISIPRCYAPADFGEIVRAELHHFSDASTIGYGQCSYLRLSNKKGKIHCALVFAKSRVAPLKVTTIPRLELTAAVTSVKASTLLKSELEYEIADEIFWTDSKVVLGYVNNDARRFHVFVANRVERIHLSSKPHQWKYIPTDENPADHASRGLSVKEMLASNWFSGPTFLWKEQIDFPADTPPELSVGDPEVKVARVLSVNSRPTDQSSLPDRLSKFSSWSRATRAVARLLRWINKNKGNYLTTVTERRKAERVIVKAVQREAYEDEMSIISQGKNVPQNNELYTLDPFIGEDGVLMVGGRLDNSSSSYTFKHPMVLPKSHPITKMIIADCHEKVKHQGKGFSMNEIRSNGFWIPGLNKVVASSIQQCVICRKQRRPTEEQRMADLPTSRVDPSPPFSYCGMDCFGPYLVQQGRSTHKRYGLLFTCFCSRAVHIEMLTDLSTDSFINGLRCFISIRGAVMQIKSDQGSNFIGARNEFREALKEVDHERIAAFLSNKQCDFVMNAPHSSHAGGVWERQIRTIKAVLNSTLSLSPGRLDDPSLRAFFYEAMAIVNNRPLTVENISDPNSLDPLTPNHLLTLKSTVALPPPGKFTREDLYTRKRWRHVQFLTEQFWSRWRKEYLANIALRQRWHVPKRNLQIGDIVMVKEEDLPRNEWRLGRVMDTNASKDGLVRKVKVKLGDKHLNHKGERVGKPSIIERPIQKLVLLLEDY